MIFERTWLLRAARPIRMLGPALALLLPLAAAPGCGSKPPPPPGAEKETGLPEIDMGTGTESGEEAKSELSHGLGSEDAGKGSAGKSDSGTPDAKDESKAAPDATGKPAADDADSTDGDSEQESTATKG